MSNCLFVVSVLHYHVSVIDQLVHYPNASLQYAESLLSVVPGQVHVGGKVVRGEDSCRISVQSLDVCRVRLEGQSGGRMCLASSQLCDQ